MVSQDQVASPNGQIFMDGETGTDATSLTGYPSGTQIGIEFKDPGGGEVDRHLYGGLACDRRGAMPSRKLNSDDLENTLCRGQCRQLHGGDQQ